MMPMELLQSKGNQPYTRFYPIGKPAILCDMHLPQISPAKITIYWLKTFEQRHFLVP